MLKREWGAESNGKPPHLLPLVKLQPRLLSLQWKICLRAELQPWCLSLHEVPALGQNSDDEDDADDDSILNHYRII